MPRELSAGHWRLRVDPEGTVAYVSYSGEELVRGLLYLVRAAHSWDTVVPEVDSVVEITEDGFRVVVRAVHPIGAARFERETTITGTPEGIHWHSVGSSDSPFEVNRNGFVVLHPLSLMGRPVVVRHPGVDEESVFPERISPHQPFRDVVGFAYRTVAGTPVRLDFAGEVFETEDQRNWSDASYKTYSRPLDLPYPYRTEAGETVEQSITLQLGPVAGPLIGIALGPDDQPERAAQIARELGLDHVRADVVAGPEGARGVERAAALAATGIAIELAVHVGADPDAALAEITRALTGAYLAAVMVFDENAPATTAHAWHAVRDGLGQLLDGVPLFVGSDDNFAELNRSRPDASWGASGVVFSLNPQLHDQRDEAVLETIDALPAMVATARDMGTEVAVSPLTLRPRRNIYRGTPIDRLGREESATDPRQGTEWAAEWVRGTIVALAASGVRHITAFEATGPRGVVDDDGTPRPIARVLSELARRQRRVEL